MQEVKKSKSMFASSMGCYTLLLCPTFGLAGIPMIVEWLRHQNESLILSDGGITVKSGILNKNSLDIKYSKINSISVKKHWYDDYGDLVIFAGNDTSGIVFKGIEKPFAVKDLIDSYIDKLHKQQ
jgi:hypothetical protein